MVALSVEVSRHEDLHLNEDLQHQVAVFVESLAGELKGFFD